MNLSGISYESFADGEGVRVSVFVSGCHRHCPGCFNPEAQNFEFGKRLTREIQSDISEHLLKTHVSGLTMLGGEPMDEENIPGTLQIVRLAKGLGKTVWIYSGYTFEELFSRHDPLTQGVLRGTDVLVDGPFIEAQKDATLAFRGSSNQRIIDVQKSLYAGSVVLYEGKF